MPLSRRIVLASGALATGAVVVPGAAFADNRNHGSLRKNPFTLGVASGDPTSDGFVLWTRLAPEPEAADGLGGMPDRSFDVGWQLAGTEKFSTLAASGTVTAVPESAHSVHVELSDLKPDTVYFYRFKVGKWTSAPAMTRTAPAGDSMPDALSMAVVSCANFEHGYFNAYGHLAASLPDIVLHLGDYFYEYHPDAYVASGGNVRDHSGPETQSLANYRQRHAQYKADPHLQAAHAVAPWVVVWDDHEVDNNWADEHYAPPEYLQPFFKDRRSYAFQAYYENMPLRKASRPDGIDMQLFRRFDWGRLATFHMMDTRQYRSQQGCGGEWAYCSDAYDPSRSITGAEQEEWLTEGFHRSDARWDFLAQQVFFAQRDSDAGPLKLMSTDAWDGYQQSRENLTNAWVDAKLRNPVVLTGDVHTHWANELKLDYDDPDAKSVGVELVTTSISTGGDGQDSVPDDSPFLKINPHLKFYNQQRGYVTAKVTPDNMEVDFQVVPTVSKRYSPVYTRASFEVADGESRLRQTYLRPVDEDNQQEFNHDDPLQDLEEGSDNEADHNVGTLD